MTESAKRAMAEEAIIAAYFAPLARGFPGAYNLEDDCAAVSVPAGHDLVLKTDPVREGLHFLADTDAADIAWKALAVNVSDLAAKAADPLAYLLALSFPSHPDQRWLARFTEGLAHAQKSFGMHLIGGDTDRAPGPLSISVTVIGTVPQGRMIRRGNARPGDIVYVSGTLGDASFGLQLCRNAAPFHVDPVDATYLRSRYLRPEPRVELIPLLRAHASAAMDLSDGLMKDAGRMARACQVALELEAAHLPTSPAVARLVAADPARLADVAAHGDDYELLLTVPASERAAFEAAATALPFPVTAIGKVSEPALAGPAAILRPPDGHPITFPNLGWDHFEG